MHLAACSAALMVAGCGGQKRQDENEPAGTYPVAVEASFPKGQKLAKRSQLEVNVRNTGTRTIPNVAVTVDGFGRKEQQEGLADPSRPIFALNGVPKQIGGFPEAKEAAPEGGETNYVNTWALGPLKPGRQKSFRWGVTAVVAGPYRLKYTVAAGLDGKAKAVDEDGGGPPTGTFAGRISDTPPKTRVADDGKTVVKGTR